MTKIIYAERLSGDIYTMSYSYSASCDYEVTADYIERIARKDGAQISVNTHRFPSNFPYGFDPGLIYPGK